MVVGDDASAWRELVESSGASYRRPNRRATDPAGIAYTSGTTGRPKGVVHSHGNLLLPGAMLINARGFGPDLRKGDCAALTILNMQVTSTLLVAQAGGTQIVMDRVDPLGVAAWVRDEAVNSWFGVPTILQGLVTADEVAVEDLRSLTDTWTGGTYLPESVRAAFEGRFGCRVSATYGLTEAPTVVTIENRDEPRMPGCSGTSLPHLVVEIRDGETGAALRRDWRDHRPRPTEPVSGLICTDPCSATWGNRKRRPRRYGMGCCTRGTSDTSTPMVDSSSETGGTH